MGVVSLDDARRTRARLPGVSLPAINVPSPSTTSAVCGRVGTTAAEGAREMGALGVCGMGGKTRSCLVSTRAANESLVNSRKQ